MEREKAAIVPAGAMGTAFSFVASQRTEPYLYAYSQESFNALKRRQSPHLEGIGVPWNAKISHNLPETLDGAKVILVASRGRDFRDYWDKVRKYRDQGSSVVSLTKVLEQGTHFRMTELMMQSDPLISDNLAVISGPTFARKIAVGQPTNVDLASSNPSLADKLKGLFENDNFKINTTTDVVGVELGGALKNVYAIAVGMYDGIKEVEGRPVWVKEEALDGKQTWGRTDDNNLADERELFLYGCLDEMMDLGEKLGAERKTFKGASGWGDFEASSTPDSRNWHAGYKLGLGIRFGKLLGAGQTVEGLQTTIEAVSLARKVRYEANILGILGKVFYRGVEPRAAFEGLKIAA